jgi:hypothetical protein
MGSFPVGYLDPTMPAPTSQLRYRWSVLVQTAPQPEWVNLFNALSFDVQLG